MKTLKPILAATALSLLMFTQTSFAQDKIEPQPDNDPEVELRTGQSATFIWKAFDKVSFDAGYTMLTTDNVSRIFRNQFSIGASYNPCKPVRIGVGYAYMAQYSKSGSLRPKHRAYVLAEGTLKTGSWKFSLYEKFQFTHSAYDIDPNEKPKNSLDLKSRLKAAYASFEHLEPYALVELWNCFNAASYSADYNATSNTYSNTKFLGYNDAYITRIRAGIGLKWKIDTRNSLDFSYMFDYTRHKRIDFDSVLGELGSYKWNNGLISNLSLGYVFAF